MKHFTLVAIVAFFLFIFSVLSMRTMMTVPLHDFDEANRAEGAKNMKEFGQYWAPLTGSPFLRVDAFRFEIPEKPYIEMFFHYERSPLVYWAMIGSTYLFGEQEFSYRFPSFIFGIGTMFFFLWILQYQLKRDRHHIPAISVSLIAFLSSIDWWLSSQSALLDTGLSFFLFLGISSLIIFLKNSDRKWLIISGVGLAGAIMSKGPPSFIFIFPVLYLVITKQLSLRHLFILFLTAGAIVLPWALLSSIRFGFEPFIRTFVLDFMMSRAGSVTPEQQAPVFWYARWWIESFRVGIILFASLLIHDVIHKRLDRPKILILTYIIPSFLLYSLVSNKVWWYVLPLIPAVSLYIFLSSQQFLQKKGSLTALCGIVSLGAIPVFYGASNTLALLYGMSLVGVSFFALEYFKKKHKYDSIALIVTSLITLVLFTLRFPAIVPTYPETREMGTYYRSLPEPKCLYVDDMPYESILFYTDAKEAEFLSQSQIITAGCNAYLITPTEYDLKLLHQIARLKIYQINEAL